MPFTWMKAFTMMSVMPPPAPRCDPPAVAPGSGAPAAPRPPPAIGYVRPRHHPWAELLHRVFAIDILACPDCGGRLRLVATIEARAVIDKILAHLGLPLDPPRPDPARSPEWLPGLSADALDAGGGDWPD